MVTQWRVYGDVESLRWIFDQLRHQIRVVNRFLRCITPNIVWRIITSPENQVGLNRLSYMLQHAFKSVHGQIAKSTAKFSSLQTWVSRVPIFFSTAEISATISIRSNFILSVQMNIGNVNCSYYFSWIWIVMYLCILFFDKIVVLYNVWFVSENTSRIILNCNCIKFRNRAYT